MASQRTTVTGGKRKRLANRRATKAAKSNRKAGKSKSEGVLARRAERRASNPVVQERKMCREAAEQAALMAPMQLCPDEGCPNAGLDHVCVPPDVTSTPAATPSSAPVNPTPAPE